ncbi:MAG: amidohydrolase family protein [Promethearchaeota archaeon]
MIVKGDLLIDGNGEVKENPTILVKDGIIEEISSEKESNLSKKEYEVVASGKTIMPGLIDAHVHLAFGKPDEPCWNMVKDNRELLTLLAARNAQKGLLKGITTIGDCGGVRKVTLNLKRAIDTGILTGPRLIVSGTPITTSAGHLHNIGIKADNKTELRKAIRTLVEDGVNFIKIMATGGYMTPISNRRRAQYSEDELREAVKDAHRLKKRVVVHVNGSEGIINSVNAGVDVLVHCNWLGEEEETIEFDESIAKIAVKKGIYVDIGPIEGFGIPGSIDQNSRWEIGCKMKELGSKVYLSSDGIGVEADKFPSDLIKLVRNTNLTPLEAITMATKIPAEALGINKYVGTLEPGKKADIIIIDGNPAENIDQLKKVDTVLKNGKIVVSETKLSIQ